MSKLVKLFENANVQTFDSTKVRIFQDLDNCLTNFSKQFEKYVGEPIRGYEEKHGTSKFWEVPSKIGETYWTTMEWMSDGRQLWNYVKKYHPIILSAPSRDQSSIIGKVKWIKKNLELDNYNLQTKAKHGYDGTSKIILNPDKYRFCSGINDILIDDTLKKIQKWVEAGGTGILHTSAENTINELKKLGL